MVRTKLQVESIEADQLRHRYKPLRCVWFGLPLPTMVVQLKPPKMPWWLPPSSHSHDGPRAPGSRPRCLPRRRPYCSSGPRSPPPACDTNAKEKRKFQAAVGRSVGLSLGSLAACSRVCLFACLLVRLCACLLLCAPVCSCVLASLSVFTLALIRKGALRLPGKGDEIRNGQKVRLGKGPRAA